MSTAHGRTRLRGDAGTAVLEAAVVAPIFTTMLLAIFDYGLLLRDYMNVSAAVSDGVKYGAIVGNDDGSASAPDLTIVHRVRQDMGSMPVDAVDRVVVFRAADSTWGSPMEQFARMPACKTVTTSVAGTCNVYPGREAFAADETSNAAYFSCTSGTEVHPCGWPSATRQNDPAFAIDYIGVYVKIKRTRIAAFLGVPTTIEIASVTRLEPVAKP